MADFSENITGRLQAFEEKLYAEYDIHGGGREDRRGCAQNLLAIVKKPHPQQ